MEKSQNTEILQQEQKTKYIVQHETPVMYTFETQSRPKLCAGILPFFDNGKTILLGKEFRERDNNFAWMEFGGQHENNETLAETACRECNEETAGTLHITIEQVQSAERLGHYVDHYNEKTNNFYRMYCLKLDGEKPMIETFNENAKGKDHVEKTEWRYFETKDVIYNNDGILPNTDIKIYKTTCIRIEKLKCIISNIQNYRKT